jgi:hypothetical protein
MSDYTVVKCTEAYEMIDSMIDEVPQLVVHGSDEDIMVFDCLMIFHRNLIICTLAQC